jgi:hypothetical protein
MATMRVAQDSRPGGPLELVERPIPDPGPGSVRIKVQACGICHSDAMTKEKLTAGQASWDTGVKIWFVMIKDAKGRFPKNDLWGDDWGWALYEAKDPKRNVATDYTTDCKVCHIPAKKTDWVYIQGHPVLARPTPPK